MAERNNKGQFTTGNKASPGRKPRPAEREYLEATIESVSLEDWRLVVVKAVKLAKAGDYQARRWLGDYVIGKPPQILELRGVEAQQLAQLIKEMEQRGMTPGDLFEAMLAELVMSEAESDDDQ